MQIIFTCGKIATLEETMEKKIIKFYGGGDRKLALSFLGISRQRADKWSKPMTKAQINGVIVNLVRAGRSVPEWLLRG
jgi:hypothetical protein